MNLTSSSVAPSGAAAGRTDASKAGGRTSGNKNRYMAPSPESQLTEGQVIKGEITNLHHNEVTVTLEDNTKITGQVEDPGALSIGDTAAFKVTENRDGQVTLKALPKSETAIENSTITKALEEAGLPKNERNQAVVRELMNHNMPIHKQSIQTILKMTYANKNIDIATLVTMVRLRLPITEQTARQLTHYKNQEHQLNQRIEILSGKLTELLDSLSPLGAEESIKDLGSQILSILLEENDASFLPDNENPRLMLSSPKEAAALVDLLETFPLSEELKKGILNGTASLKETAAAIDQGMEYAAQLDANALMEYADTLKDGPKAPGPDIQAYPPSSEDEIPKVIDLFNHPVVETVRKAQEDMQALRLELASFLPKEDRRQLLLLLKDFPLRENMREKIDSGQATAREFLTVIKNILPLVDPREAKELFRSREFKSILRQDISGSWTLTPKTLTKPHAVDHLYEKLYNQLDQIDKLLHETAPSHKLTPELSSESGQVKENLEFIKLINEMYTFVQLPLRFKDKNIHSDLYVYTNKRALKEHPEAISVLLHLDMDYLGPLDIHISLAGNQIASKFYFTNDQARTLSEENVKLLSNSLEEKGFLLRAEFLKREREVDFVEDFLEKDLLKTSLKRYSFDIRA